MGWMGWVSSNQSGLVRIFVRRHWRFNPDPCRDIMEVKLIFWWKLRFDHEKLKLRVFRIKYSWFNRYVATKSCGFEWVVNTSAFQWQTWWGFHQAGWYNEMLPAHVSWGIKKGNMWFFGIPWLTLIDSLAKCWGIPQANPHNSWGIYGEVVSEF